MAHDVIVGANNITGDTQPEGAGGPSAEKDREEEEEEGEEEEEEEMEEEEEEMEEEEENENENENENEDDEEEDGEEAVDEAEQEVREDEQEAAVSPEAGKEDANDASRRETEGKNEGQELPAERDSTVEAEPVDAPAHADDMDDMDDWDDEDSEDEDEDSPFGIHRGADASSSSDLGDWALLLAYWVGEEDAVRKAVTEFGGHDEKFSIVLFDELMSDREEGTLKEAWKCFKLLTAFAKRLAVKPGEGLDTLHIDTL